MSACRPVAALVLTALMVRAATAQQGTRMTWQVDGAEREALVFAPTARTPGGKPPLILIFHGHGGNVRGFASLTHFQTAWPEAVVVALQGLPIASAGDPAGVRAGWDSGPNALSGRVNRDLDFVDSVLATMRRRYPIDETRTYAAGFSNGAFFTLMLWTARPTVFAAYAPVAGLMRDWRPSVPRPVLYIAGVLDTLFRPDSQKATVDRIRGFDNAGANGTACGSGCMYYASTSATPVRVLTHPAGHVYPPFATAAIVAFFKNHPLRIP